MASLKKLMSDYGLGVIIILLLLAFAVSTLSDYINNKALGGSEGQEMKSRRRSEKWVTRECPAPKHK